jgi:ABC transport system ATP-binding/permease protein
VETPGGWKDFLEQNPGFFAPPVIKTPVKPQAAADAKTAPARAKLSYKDQRRLAELEALVAGLPGKIAAQEAGLADPGLYGRDPAGFQQLSRELDTARAELAAAEEEWLALEERREALETGR